MKKQFKQFGSPFIIKPLDHSQEKAFHQSIDA